MHPRNSSQKHENYALQGIMNVHLNPFDKMVDSYFIVVGRKYNILQILDSFIENFDNPEYVKVVFPLEKEEPAEDKTNNLTRFVQLNVNKDDIPLIGKKNVPIRITCTTDAFPENKDALIDLFKELRSIMRY